MAFSLTFQIAIVGHYLRKSLRRLRRLSSTPVLLITATLGLTGCLTPQPYAVTATSTGLRISTPYSYTNDNGRASIAYFPQRQTAECYFSARVNLSTMGQPADIFGASGRPGWRGGKLATAVLFEGSESRFATADTLDAALTKWWESDETASFRNCFSLDKPSVRRALLAQRTQTSNEILQSEFAFDGLKHGPKWATTLLLRPGVRVCATDVGTSPRKAREWTIGGHTCTRVVRAPNGGTYFDPVIGAFNGLTVEGHQHKHVYRVASWAEISRPALGAYLWVLVNPINLPLYGDESPADSEVPIVAGIAMSEGTVPAALLNLLKTQPTDHVHRIKNLCGSDGVICYKFGERSTFTVDFKVFANGTGLDVPVGATLGDLAAVVAPDIFAPELMTPAEIDDPAWNERARLNLSRLTMQRVFDGRLVTVDLSRAGAKAYDLHLQPGDRFKW